MDIKTAMQVRAPNHLALLPALLEQPENDLLAIFRSRIVTHLHSAEISPGYEF